MCIKYDLWKPNDTYIFLRDVISSFEEQNALINGEEADIWGRVGCHLQVQGLSRLCLVLVKAQWHLQTSSQHRHKELFNKKH